MGAFESHKPSDASPKRARSQPDEIGPNNLRCSLDYCLGNRGGLDQLRARRRRSSRVMAWRGMKKMPVLGRLGPEQRIVIVFALALILGAVAPMSRRWVVRRRSSAGSDMRL